MMIVQSDLKGIRSDFERFAILMANCLDSLRL